jgi:hypothetical protein
MSVTGCEVASGILRACEAVRFHFTGSDMIRKEDEPCDESNGR